MNKRKTFIPSSLFYVFYPPHKDIQSGKFKLRYFIRNSIKGPTTPSVVMVDGFGCTIIMVALWAGNTSVSVDTNAWPAKESYHPWDTTKQWLSQRSHKKT